MLGKTVSTRLATLLIIESFSSNSIILLRSFTRIGVVASELHTEPLLILIGVERCGDIVAVRLERVGIPCDKIES